MEKKQQRQAKKMKEGVYNKRIHDDRVTEVLWEVRDHKARIRDLSIRLAELKALSTYSLLSSSADIAIFPPIAIKSYSQIKQFISKSGI